MKRKPGPQSKKPSEKYVKIGVSVPPEMRRWFDESKISPVKFIQNAVKNDKRYQEWLKALP
jgi:hypothetical protein